jgi:hypothetical protein
MGFLSCPMICSDPWDEDARGNLVGLICTESRGLGTTGEIHIGEGLASIRTSSPHCRGGFIPQHIKIWLLKTPRNGCAHSLGDPPLDSDFHCKAWVLSGLFHVKQSCLLSLATRKDHALVMVGLVDKRIFLGLVGCSTTENMREG